MFAAGYPSGYWDFDQSDRTRRNSRSWPAVVSDQLNRSAYARVAPRWGGFVRTRETAFAIPNGVRSLNSTPATSDVTTSGVPETSVAATGVPQAIASSSTFAHPSRSDARISTSAAL